MIGPTHYADGYCFSRLVIFDLRVAPAFKQ